MAHILVAGGGLAGLSSSVALVKRGHRVTLVERRTRLGGRTHALPARRQGDVVDNGQHVMLAGYRATRAFLDELGTGHLLHVVAAQATLFRDPSHGPTWMRGRELPGPAGRLAPLLGMLGLGNVPLLDRLRGLRAMPALAAAARAPDAALDTITADAWLRRLRVPPSLRRAFWDPLIVSTLNEKPERVSAHMLALLLRFGTLAAPSDARLAYPTVDLDALFVTPAVRRLAAGGARVVCGRSVASLAPGRAVLDDGEVIRADAILLALDPTGLARLVEKTALAADPFFSRVARIQSAPIVAINLWLDRPLATRSPFEGLLDCDIEWVFDRGRMTTRGGAGHYYTLITSASHGLMELTQAELLERAAVSLRRCYPDFERARVVDASVVKHPRATFSAQPGFAALRCTQVTPVAGLFLAGDWTDTELPSTMESAVESGVRAVRAIDAYLAVPRARAMTSSSGERTTV